VSLDEVKIPPRGHLTHFCDSDALYRRGASVGLQLCDTIRPSRVADDSCPCYFYDYYCRGILLQCHICKVLQGNNLYLSCICPDVFILLGYGYVQDALHVVCIGFFGVRWHCVDSQETLLVITLLNPLFYPLLGLLAMAALISQLIQVLMRKLPRKARHKS